MKSVLTFFTLFLLTSRAITAATYYVNDNSLTNDIYATAVGNNANTGLTPAQPFATLAMALSVAVSGDQIFVDAGNYTDINLVIPSTLNNVTITGASISTTIFDGSAASGIFLFMTIRGDNIVIENLTITEYDNAGAIDIISSSASDSTNVRFNECYFYRNETFTSFDTNPHGGAVYIATGSGNLPAVVSFYYCQLGDNLAEQSAGGGAIYINGRSRLYMYGSRMTCNNSRAILTTYEGGTILFQNAYGELDSCYISGSKVIDQQGGAIRGINSTARLAINLKNTIFTENSGRQGAAVFVEDNLDCNFINCVVYTNTVTGGFGDGGSINCAGAANVSIVNSTIADNLSTHASDGGGLANEGTGTYTVYNSIIWNNQVSNIRTPNISATYCDIQPINANHSGITGNITGNPLFVGAGNYTLQVISPCVNAGNVTGAPSTDLTNFTRTGNPDMGAFELGATNPVTSTLCTLFLICTPPAAIPLTADNASICTGTSTSIIVNPSTLGILYQLVNNGTSSNVGSPVLGNGGLIALPTGNLTATTTYSVIAYDPTFPTCTATLGPITVTVNPLPVVTVSSASVCVNGAITLTPTTGGTWVSNNPSLATVTAGGVVTIVDQGSVSFTFTNTNSCSATTSSVTINPLPVVTVSSASVCVDGTLTLTPTIGGTWVSNNPSVATVTAGGVVTIVDQGSVSFTFTNTNSCSATTSSVTINPLPVVTVSSASVCVNGTLTLTPTTGGTWVSNNPSVATVTAGGVVTIVGQGSVSFTFTNTNSCSATTSSVTINPLPVVTVSSASVCVNGTLTLTPTTGGTWVSNNPSVATVTAGGVVTIVDQGSVSFTFTNTNSCSATTSSVTINPLPVVTVSSASVCVDGTLTLTPTTGGTWVSNNPSVATVTAGGVVTIVDQGSVSFTFTNTNSCSATTSSVTINPLPVVTVSSASVCVDGTLTLTPTTGGTWVSNNPSVATVTAGGVVTIVDQGSVSFTFTNTNSCSATTSSVTINPLPVVTVSSASVCVDGTLTLTPTTGGSWVSNNTSVATVTAGGVVTIVDQGSVSFTFTNTNSCSATTSSVTINPLPLVTVSSASVCVDGTLTLTPTTGGTWVSNNPSVATVTAGGVVTIVDQGTVSFTFTNTNSCSATTSSVTINPLPVVTVSSASVCVDGTLTLTPTTGGTWVSNNPSVATVTAGGVVTIVDQGTVSFTFTNTNSCSATTSSVTINPLPTLLPLTNVTLCAGQPLTLSGNPSSGVTYSWSGPNSFTATNQSPTVTSSATAVNGGVYTLIINDGTCSNSANLTVVINALPVIDLSNISIGSPSVCGGLDGTITGITATGAPVLVYEWNALGSQGTPDLTAGAGSYTLMVTDGNGCEASTSPIVLSDPTPPAQPTITLNPAILCVGDNFTLTVDSPDPNATYAWNGPNGYTNSGTSITLNSITSLQEGNYTVTPTVGGCTGGTSLPTFVTVNSLPIVSILTSNLTIDCTNPVVLLDGSNSEQGATISYNWTTANGALIGLGTSELDSTSSVGDYTLTVLNTATGCVANQSVSVSSNTVLPSAVAGNDIQLNCSFPMPYFPQSLNGIGSEVGATIEYVWTTTGSAIISNDNTLTPTVDGPGIFTLNVTNTANGCSAISTVTITLDTLSPNAVVASNSVILCNGSTVVLDGSASTGTGLSYSWTTSNGTIDSQISSAATVSSVGNYQLEVTGSNGCTDVSNVTVTLASPIVLSVTPTIVNSDCGNDTGGFTGAVVNGDPTLTYAWEDAQNNLIGNSLNMANLGIGDYTLTVTDGNGCTAGFGPFTIENVTAPVINDYTITQPTCDVTLGSVQVTGSFDEYVLTGINPILAPISNTNGLFTNLAPGVYELVVYDGLCVSTAITITISSVDELDCNFDVVVPDGFSPNGDNVNDVLVITNIDKFPNNVFTVFNRWGNIVYEKEGYLNTWDGTSQAKLKIGGEDLPTGTYFYILDLRDDALNPENRVLKGYVFLTR